MASPVGKRRADDGYGGDYDDGYGGGEPAMGAAGLRSDEHMAAASSPLDLDAVAWEVSTHTVERARAGGSS